MYSGVPVTWPGLGHRDIVDGPRQTEIGDLHALDAVFEQDIRRLDIAMNQTLLVSGRQSLGNLHSDAQDLGGLQQSAPVDLLLQRLAGDVLHDQVGRTTRLLDGEDGHHVVMTDGRCGPCFAQKPLDGSRIVGKRRRQQLDGHDPLELGVKRLEHNAHAAVSDHFDDLVEPQLADAPGGRARFEEIQR